MGNIGDSISDTAPAVGTAGPGYATTINSLLTEIKARLIAKIPLSSLLTNADLDLNGQALLNAGYITLVDEAVSPVASPINRIAAYAGDFWWVSAAGALKLTNGATLNAAGIGGITGDYDGSPEEFRYDAANTRYDAFSNQATNTWAYVRARAFDVAGSAASAFRARLAYGGGANVTYTLPAAAPAAAQVVTMDATGALLTNGVLGSNVSITVSGTGDFKHGDRSIHQDPLAGLQAAGSVTFGVSADVISAVLDGGLTSSYILPLRGLKVGDRIKTVLVYATSATDGAVTLYKQIGDTSSGTIACTVTDTFPANESKLMTLDTPYVVNGLVYLRLTSGINDTTFHGITITYDRP